MEETEDLANKHLPPSTHKGTTVRDSVLFSKGGTSLTCHSPCV